MFRLSRFPARLDTFEFEGGRYYVYLNTTTGEPETLKLSPMYFGDGMQTWAWQELTSIGERGSEWVFHMFTISEDHLGSMATFYHYGTGPDLQAAWTAAFDNGPWKDVDLPAVLRRIVDANSITYLLTAYSSSGEMVLARKLVDTGFFASHAEAVDYVWQWRSTQLPYTHYAPYRKKE